MVPRLNRREKSKGDHCKIESKSTTNMASNRINLFSKHILTLDSDVFIGDKIAKNHYVLSKILLFFI